MIICERNILFLFDINCCDYLHDVFGKAETHDSKLRRLDDDCAEKFVKVKEDFFAMFKYCIKILSFSSFAKKSPDFY